EVTNRTIEQYLRAFVHAKPNTWFRFLPWAEYHYNTSFHTSSGLSPFQVMFGKPPPSIPVYVLGSSSVDACDLLLSDRADILELLRKNLAKAQRIMKNNADAHRREVNYDVGTWVYVKLQPYRQTSLAGVKYNKLSKRYYGPFLIIGRVGKVAYKLELPSYSKIHNVFHCSVLKPHIGPIPTAVDELPTDDVDNHPLVSPLAILATKEEVIDGESQVQVLVQWKGLSPDDTSWEPWNQLKSVYNLEDKVGFDGEGIVMNPTHTAGPNHIDGLEEVYERPKRITKLPDKLKDFVLRKETPSRK
ncbi:Ty-3/Gypsy retrotransposon polyprotein, partial [Trifolium medium]|nr:Ty-3/Gypsy retrotransposon polyprotein [Trifolium medium]